MNDTAIFAVLSNRSTRRQAIIGAAVAFGGLALRSTKAWAGDATEIRHAAESWTETGKLLNSALLQHF